MSTESDLKRAEDALFRANVARDPARGKLLTEVRALRDRYAREVNGGGRSARPAVARTAPVVAPSASPRCLSVRQPWAAAIVAGLKTEEFRSWPTRYRGPLYIHAAARRADAAALAEFPTLKAVRIVYGAIVGVVDLVVVEDEGDGFAWVLANPRPLAVPFPCKGALSLWTPPAGLRL